MGPVTLCFLMDVVAVAVVVIAEEVAVVTGVVAVISFVVPVLVFGVFHGNESGTDSPLLQIADAFCASPCL